MKKAILLSPLLFVALLLQAQTPPTLLKDINATTIPFNVVNNDPSNFCTINGLTYYAGYTFNTGRTIWRTDGTSAGTSPLFYNSGLNWFTNSSNNSEITPALTGMNGNLYFFSVNLVTSGNPSYNMVKSDLSGNVSILAKSTPQNDLTAIMSVQSSNRGDGSPRRMAALNNTLYFPFSDTTNGTELWKTDGTASGTTMVKDLNAGGAGSAPANFIATSNYVFFTTFSGNNNALWRTDGTAAGTILLKDSVASANNTRCFTVINNKLYFVGINSISNTLSIWQSDGSVTGTNTVEQTAASSIPNIRAIAMKQGNNLIYALGGPLTKYDGVTKTQLTTVTSTFRQNAWAEVNGTLYYGVQGPVNALWKTDGTPAGTVRIKDSITTFNYLNANGTLFFAGNEYLNGTTYGIELWKSDGTTTGTQRLSNFNTTTTVFNGDGIVDLTNTYTMTVQNGKVLLSVHNGAATPQGSTTLLASSDGTVAGTTIINLASVTGSSYPAARFVWKNELYFSAYDDVRGNELWKTDGTPAGTALLKDVHPGTQSSYVQAFTPYKNSLYFFTTDTSGGFFRNALWKTDGTTAGTVKVKDSLGNFTYAHNKVIDTTSQLVFIAGGAVYVSDGTAAGTLKIPMIAPAATAESKAGNAVLLNGNLIVAAEAYNNILGATELWKVDPVAHTAARYLTGFMIYPEMVRFDNAVYLIRERTPNTGNYMLWKTDGTAAGTVVADTCYYPKQLTVTDNGQSLYYISIIQANKHSYIRKLTAGSSTPVTMKEWADDKAYNYVYDNTFNYYGLNSIYYTFPYITRLYPDQYPYFVQRTVNSPVLFPSGNNYTGIEILQTDGTSGGTTIFKDIMQGAADGKPQYFIHALNKQGDSILVFTANDGSGPEIWVSDGTAAGARNLSQTAPNSSSLNPQYLTLLNDKVIFWGTSLEKGTELYGYDVNQVLAVPGAPTAAIRSLTLYPNPAHDAVNVKAANGTQIALYNLMGAVLYKTVVANGLATIPVIELPAGVYSVMAIGDDGQRQTGKFVKY